MVRRHLLFVLALLCGLAASATVAAQRRRAVNPAPRPGNPLPGLSPEQVALFEAGRVEFLRIQQLDDGLGPVQNGRSCGQCHFVGGVGGGSIVPVIRFGRRTNNGEFDPLVHRGGPVLQSQSVKRTDGASFDFSAETLPPEANLIVRRRTPPLFGLSLVDATPDATFVALAAEQAARNDGTAGRVAMVDNTAAGMKTVGKFGWKAQNPTLFQFSGEAYLNELGITSPFFPNENCPNGRCAELQFNPRPGLNDDGAATQAVADFMALLAPPPRGWITDEVLAGEAVFHRIGCASCHVSTLQTGPNDNPALDRVTYHPYSDFLLHDMGFLGDGMPQGAAGPREMRTAPLWGLGLDPPPAFRTFLHDGRAHSIEVAIEAHEGQGTAARDGFRALDEADRAKLMAFLRSL